MITLDVGVDLFRARSRSMPLSPHDEIGRITSNRTRSSWSIASVPDRASVTSIPSPEDRRKEETIIGSSSTTRTRFKGFRISQGFLLADRPQRMAAPPRRG